MKRFFLILIMVIGVMLFCVSGMANTGEQGLDVLSNNEESPLLNEPTHAKSQYIKDTVYKQTTLKGIFSGDTVYFQIPKYWSTRYVYAEINYDVSELIESVASSMTFYVNSVPLHSYHIEYKNGATQTCYVEIPVNMLNTGFNTFEISAYARLYDEEGCIDDFSDANWLSINESSYIRCGYDVIDTQQRLCYYPYPFISTINPSGLGLTICLPDEPSNEEIAAAMKIMGDLSQESEEKNEIKMCLYSDLEATSPSKVIFVALYDKLPKDLREYITEDDRLKDYGEIVNIIDKNKRNVLIATAKDYTCLEEAVNLLTDSDRISQEKGTSAFVKKGSSDIYKDKNEKTENENGYYTIGDLVGGGINFVGPFHQSNVIYMPFSDDYILSEAGSIDLKYRYSENLDFNRSLITVYWGNVPIISKKLTKENALNDELIFSMPDDVVGTGEKTITIVFDLEIPDMVCTPRQDQMPWAYVSENSTLYLPCSEEDDISLSKRPAPFQKNGKYNDVLLVVSDAPSSQEIDIYGQLVALYSTDVNPYGNLRVIRNSEFSTADGNYNIITVGSYISNSLIKKINNSLAFSFNDDGSSFLSNEQQILSEGYAKRIVTLQLFKSPFSEDRVILTATGVENKFDVLNEILRDYNERENITGDCILIDTDGEMKTYTFNKSDKLAHPEFIEIAVNNRQSVLFTIAATSVMLMILIGIIIVLLRIRYYYKKNYDIHNKEQSDEE